MIPFKVLKNHTVNFIHYTHLIVNKMLVGRTKDKLDVEELQKIIRIDKKLK